MAKIRTAAVVFLTIAGIGAGVHLLRPDITEAILCRLSWPAASSDRESWTLAFYLAGDNSLERDQLRNLREICAGSPAVADAPVVVFIDRDNDISRDSPLSAWKGSRLFAVTEEDYLKVIGKPLDVDIPLSVDSVRFEGAIADRLQDPGDRDLLLNHYEKRGGYYVLKQEDPGARDRIRTMLTEKAGYLLPLRGSEHVNLVAAEAGTLSRFVHFVKDNFPADRYLLCIAGHGNGWFSEEAAQPPPAGRRSAEYFMDFEIPNLKQALKDNPVDVLVLDMCSMGDIETAWELRECTRYLVSNQTAIPTMGLDYTLFLKRLERQKDLTAQGIARDAAEAYRDTYGSSRQFDLSVAALDLGEDFRAFVESFQRAVSDPSLLPAIRRAGETARYVPGRHKEKYPMADLLPLLAALGDAELEPFVSHKPFMIHHAAVNSELTGISLYLPGSTERYLLQRQSYAETSFARDFSRGWASILPELLTGK